MTIQTWLDRLALAMQLSGISEVTATDLAANGLHDDLSDMAPTEETLGELAARALLRDSDGVVRFPANVMKEARAARALLEAGERGLEILRRHVLVELGVQNIHDRPVLPPTRPGSMSSSCCCLPQTTNGVRRSSPSTRVSWRA